MYVSAIPLSDMSEEKRGENDADSSKKKEKNEDFFSSTQIFNWDEPMKDFLLLFFSLFLSFQPLEIKLIDDDGW